MDAFTAQNRVGDVVNGTVTSITDFGAFVRVGAVEGLLHNQEISWDKSKNAKSELKVGDEVEVKIIKIDRDAGKISLSKKALEDSPVKAFAQNHKNGSIVTGTVTSITDFGAFVRVGAVEGLLHNQEISWDKSKNAKSELKTGDEVEVKIIKIDRDAGKISLSKKALEDSPVKAFAETHKNGAIVTGTVKDKKDFGVFIALEDSIDALIRTEDLHPLKLDEIEKGQEIKGVISFIDANTDRIRVSVKRLERQE
jgi:small subunit ribosomal protein S1